MEWCALLNKQFLDKYLFFETGKIIQPTLAYYCQISSAFKMNTRGFRHWCRHRWNWPTYGHLKPVCEVTVTPPISRLWTEMWDKQTMKRFCSFRRSSESILLTSSAASVLVAMAAAAHTCSPTNKQSSKQHRPAPGKGGKGWLCAGLFSQCKEKKGAAMTQRLCRRALSTGWTSRSVLESSVAVVLLSSQYFYPPFFPHPDISHINTHPLSM